MVVFRRRGRSERSELPLSALPYSGIMLRLYDLFVLRFTSPYAWGCDRDSIARLYATYGTTQHAEVGVGSGHFLSAQPKDHWETLTLIDPNPAALSYTSARVGGTPTVYAANILCESGLPRRRHKSVAANYLLHCLPGPMAAKEPAIRNLSRLTDEDGTLFGATVIGRSAEHNLLGRALMWACNRTGTFGNTLDTESELRLLLERYFSTVVIRRQSTVALFVASSPRSVVVDV